MGRMIAQATGHLGIMPFICSRLRRELILVVGCDNYAFYRVVFGFFSYAETTSKELETQGKQFGELRLPMAEQIICLQLAER